MSEPFTTPGPDGLKNNQPFESSEGSAPLTRRELRALERAALSSTGVPTPMEQQAPPPAFAAPQVAPQQFGQDALPAVASSVTDAVVPAVVTSGTDVVLPAVVTSAIDVVLPAIAAQSTVVTPEQSMAVNFPVAAPEVPEQPIALTAESSGLRVRSPKKPSVLLPVMRASGATRPQGPTPASVRRAVAAANRKPFKRQVLAKMMTFGAMIGAGLMIVATSVPANAFYSADAQTAAVAAPKEAEAQVINVEPSADLTLTRDGYTATSFREQIFLRYGNRSFLYTNNPNGTIQWPFPIAVPISDTFGYRLDDCNGYCADFHKGVDFLPGEGTTIQAIADGVVSSVINSHSGLGNHVIIDHQINGRLVQSVYAHMQDDSIKVVVGQAVKVADPIGLVGSTGLSTGPHLHLEIHIGGVPVDPFEWLKANAN